MARLHLAQAREIEQWEERESAREKEEELEVKKAEIQVRTIWDYWRRSQEAGELSAEEKREVDKVFAEHGEGLREMGLEPLPKKPRPGAERSR